MLINEYSQAEDLSHQEIVNSMRGIIKDYNLRSAPDDMLMQVIAAAVVVGEWSVLQKETPIVTLTEDQAEMIASIGEKIIPELQRDNAVKSFETIARKSGIFGDFIAINACGHNFLHCNRENLTFFHMENVATFALSDNGYVRLDYADNVEEQAEELFGLLRKLILGLYAFCAQNPGCLQDGPIEKFTIKKIKKGELRYSAKRVPTYILTGKSTRTVSAHYRRGHLRLLTAAKWKNKRFQLVPVKATMVKARAAHIDQEGKK